MVRAGIKPRSLHCHPSLHGLRHTFAVSTILDAYCDGGDVEERLAALSTYLGHVDPAKTYLYLSAAHVSCLGKGRKQRITPLTAATVNVLRVWLDERGRQEREPLFPSRSGGSLSRDGLERRIAKHAASAARTCSSLREKKVTA